MHTQYSRDCSTPLEDIVGRCLETGIDCITISDHGTVEGALKMQKIAPFKVIVAEEILTPVGEVMGMFLKETIPSNISLEEAISRIKAQGGLVNFPHPFDPLRGIKLDSKKLDELASQIDVMEVFNARCPWSHCATKARTFARQHDIPGTAGSDAHSAEEIGSTYVEMPEFDGMDSFLQALREGHIVRHKSSILVHFGSTWTKIKKAL